MFPAMFSYKSSSLNNQQLYGRRGRQLEWHNHEAKLKLNFRIKFELILVLKTRYKTLHNRKTVFQLGLWTDEKSPN